MKEVFGLNVTTSVTSVSHLIWRSSRPRYKGKLEVWLPPVRWRPQRKMSSRDLLQLRETARYPDYSRNLILYSILYSISKPTWILIHIQYSRIYSFIFTIGEIHSLSICITQLVALCWYCICYCLLCHSILLGHNVTKFNSRYWVTIFLMSRFDY